jgi:hypothetical protein
MFSPSYLEFGEQRSGIPFSPSAPDLGEKLLAVLFHFFNQTVGRPCLFVPRSPNQQLQQHRRQINAFLR